jgi:hypothetical protein
MAVANKQRGRTPKHYELTLADGQIVNVMAVRGGMTVGDERDYEAVLLAVKSIQERVEFKLNEAIQAEDTKTYESKLRYAQKFQREFGNIESKIERLLLLTVTEWDVALTVEQEEKSDFVPLSPEGMSTLEYEYKLAIFNALMDEFKEERDSKKESGASRTDNGTPVRANSANAPPEPLTTS